jgi:hypothetical protein
MPEPEAGRDRTIAITRARNAVRDAALTLAGDSGAQTITRPAFPGSESSVRDIEPTARMRAARDLELAARHAALRYIRDAREAGLDWHDIGEALNITAGGDAQQADETVAEAAYTYATRNPDAEAARRYGRSFTWECPCCDRRIADRGPLNGPADDEHGHAQNCARQASAIAAWTTGWEAAP